MFLETEFARVAVTIKRKDGSLQTIVYRDGTVRIENGQVRITSESISDNHIIDDDTVSADIAMDEIRRI
jgi:hypothetical protein